MLNSSNSFDFSEINTANSFPKISREVLQYSLDLILQETVNSVVLTDADERILWVNKAFTQITEYSYEEALGKKPGAFLQGKNTDVEARKYLRDCIEKEVPFQCDILNYSKSGREYWIDIKGQPVFDENGKLVQFFSIQTDITDRIISHQKLKEINKIKDRVISVMSHDIKAPVASLQGVLELVSQKILTVDEFPSMIEQLSKSASSLGLLIDNILGWVKVQLQNPDHIQMQVVNLSILTNEIIALYKPIADLKNIKLISTVLPNQLAYANSDYLLLIIRNLLNNAIKFSENGKSIALSVEEQENVIAYKIEDSGIGMSAEDIQRLLSSETFTRLGTANEKGSGLGLTFVKESVEKCGGELFIESAVGKGSSFSFTICRLKIELFQ